MTTAQLVTALAADVCPVAPPGVQTYADQILAWVKWAVLAIMGISFFASIGMVVWGRVTHHPKGARLGFDGLMICLAGAIIYVAGYAIIISIIGVGCGTAAPSPAPTLTRWPMSAQLPELPVVSRAAA